MHGLWDVQKQHKNVCNSHLYAILGDCEPLAPSFIFYSFSSRGLSFWQEMGVGMSLTLVINQWQLAATLHLQQQ